jgi:hypothetical protein
LQFFLNGQTGVFVARISGLAEEGSGWQAFFLEFFAGFFSAVEARFGTRGDSNMISDGFSAHPFAVYYATRGDQADNIFWWQRQ